MPSLPPQSKFQEWPESFGESSPEQIISLYEQGFAGAIYDPEGEERLRQEVALEGGYALGVDAAHVFGLADSAAGKLVVNYFAIEQCYPGSIPGPAQECGDCVSHSTKNASLYTLCCEAAA